MEITSTATPQATELAVGDVMAHTNRKGTVRTCTVSEAPSVNAVGVAWVRVDFTDADGIVTCIPVKVTQLSRTV